MKVGVLALQGAVREHVRSLEQAGADAVAVKSPEDLKDLDGIVLPGGESTTIGKLMRKYQLLEPLQQMAKDGFPMFGTCAGMILLANHIEGQDDVHLGVMDVTVDRNSFGRQRESFETDLEIPELGPKPLPAVFIRAPHIVDTGKSVDVLATYGDRIVAARQGHLLAASFHPELTDDMRLHGYFLDMIRDAARINR